MLTLRIETAFAEMRTKDMKSKLEVRSETRGDQVRVYTLSGSLFGSSDSYAFQDEVRQVASSGIRGIVIDFAAVQRIDSSGVGIVVAMMWSASQAGGRLILAALPERIREVLSIAILLDHVDHTDTVQQALAKLDAE